MSNAAIPSLMSNTAALEIGNAHDSRSLLDLMYDGFYMLFLLKNHSLPIDVGQFASQIRKFLTDFEKAAKRLNAATEDIFDAKYAFCATVDETVLRSGSRIRDHWEHNPLQLTLFGHQLAGENFFVKLDELRSQSKARMQVLEVFHMCLLLGFEGKYMMEGPEKLAYLTARLGDDIAASKGKRVGFAPRSALPDRIMHTLQRAMPIWVLSAALGCIALVGFIGLSWSLHRQTDAVITQYGGVIQLAPDVAHVTITLP
jgi:type VI secretion system protein ImpK